jgi:hypothetical protein
MAAACPQLLAVLLANTVVAAEAADDAFLGNLLC